jgi:hypothetical protein
MLATNGGMATPDSAATGASAHTDPVSPTSGSAASAPPLTSASGGRARREPRWSTSRPRTGELTATPTLQAPLTRPAAAYEPVASRTVRIIGRVNMPTASRADREVATRRRARADLSSGR